MLLRLQLHPQRRSRYITFHTHHRFCYVINQTCNTDTAFAYDKITPTLIQVPEISTIPNDYDEFMETDDIHLVLDAPFLYRSNYGTIRSPISPSARTPPVTDMRRG